MTFPISFTIQNNIDFGPLRRGQITHIHALLNQGEAVHTLQRAIHHGPIGARRGRSLEQMTAISSCLTLLTNIVMTWNATKMQAVRDSVPETYPEAHMRRIAPITHRHINMRGRMTFDFSRHRARLLNLFATEISQKLNIVA